MATAGEIAELRADFSTKHTQSLVATPEAISAYVAPRATMVSLSAASCGPFYPVSNGLQPDADPTMVAYVTTASGQVLGLLLISGSIANGTVLEYSAPAGAPTGPTSWCGRSYQYVGYVP